MIIIVLLVNLRFSPICCLSYIWKM